MHKLDVASAHLCLCSDSSGLKPPPGSNRAAVLPRLVVPDHRERQSCFSPRISPPVYIPWIYPRSYIQYCRYVPDLSVCLSVWLVACLAVGALTPACRKAPCVLFYLRTHTGAYQSAIGSNRLSREIPHLMLFDNHLSLLRDKTRWIQAYTKYIILYHIFNFSLLNQVLHHRNLL